MRNRVLPYSVCGVFLSKYIHFLYITLSLTEFFLPWDIKNLSFIRSWNQVCDLSWKTMDFGWAQVLAMWVLVLAHGFKSQSEVNSFPSFLGTKIPLSLGLPGGTVVKNPPANTEDVVSLIPVSGRPTGGRNGSPLRYSSLENPMDRAAWWAAVQGVTKCQTPLVPYEHSFQAEHQAQGPESLDYVVWVQHWEDEEAVYLACIL